MTRRFCWLWVTLACFVVVALSCGAAGAADKTKVDRATTQVEQGAKQIGRGKVGPFKEMFTGIGHRIVDGAKCSGNTMVSSSRRLSAADHRRPDRRDVLATSPR
jgi:hypothetical protein